MRGLTSEQVKQLLSQYGQNVLTEQKKIGIAKKLLEQFNNFLIILLLFAAVLSFFLKETVNGTLIVAIVVLNAIFGLYQEYKAEEAVSLLKKMTVTRIRVIRNGKEEEIDSRDLVPGDVIVIEEGVKVPADAVLVEAKNLELNESALTGESMPVPKADKEKIFMGTIVAKGRAYAQVVHTGMNTEFGKITAHLTQIEKVKSPLQRKLESLSRTIGIVGIVISTGVFFLAYFLGAGYFPSFLLAISLAVAVVPEGLPAVMTITLAIGMKEMAKKKAVMKKLTAIETLGSVTLIATDKTGTITSNKMTVKEVFVDENVYGSETLPHHSNHPFMQIILNGILCSTASLVYVHEREGREDHEKYDVLGDPTEGALLLMAKKSGISPDKIREEWKVIDEVPFDSVTKKMTVEVQKGRHKLQFTKGAVESLLEVSAKIQIGEKEVPLTRTKLEQIKKTMNQWAAKGYRVLSFGYRKDGIASQDSKKNMTFLGMVAIHDPIRPEAREAIERARKAGIKVVMITGDNEKTAETIGKEAGLIQKGDEILVGKQLDDYSDAKLLQILPNVKIFARTTPFHKSRIVSLYQKMGEIVAVTGDGVNDAIALKQSDVGIAMGLVGTDVARETADMVILDDNFATIVNAVEEGRNIVKKIKNAVKYLFTGNFSEAVALIGGLALGLPHLFFPIQFLYINLISDGLPALALAFSPPGEHVMRRKPEKKLTIIGPFDKKFIFSVGTLASILVLSSYFIFRDHADILGKTAAFSVLSILQSFIFMDLWFSHGRIEKNLKAFISPIFLTAFLGPFVLQYAILSIPKVAELFRITTVSFSTYLHFALISLSMVIAIEGVKFIFKRHDSL